MRAITKKDIKVYLQAIEKPMLAERMLLSDGQPTHEVTRDEVCRALYQQVVRDLVAEHNFGFRESAGGQPGQVNLLIKGYPNDVWDYLMEAYDVIHSYDVTGFLQRLNSRKRP